MTNSELLTHQREKWISDPLDKKCNELLPFQAKPTPDYLKRYLEVRKQLSDNLHELRVKLEAAEGSEEKAAKRMKQNRSFRQGQEMVELYKVELENRVKLDQEFTHVYKLIKRLDLINQCCFVDFYNYINLGVEMPPERQEIYQRNQARYDRAKKYLMEKEKKINV